MNAYLIINRQPPQKMKKKRETRRGHTTSARISPMAMRAAIQSRAALRGAMAMRSVLGRQPGATSVLSTKASGPLLFNSPLQSKQRRAGCKD